MKTKIAISWSSGKDSAYMLGLLLQNPHYDVCALLTTFNEKYQRVAMHGVRESLVMQQASRIGIPLWKIQLPDACDNATYGNIMSIYIAQALQQGITHMAFGDLFLEDIKQYRVNQLKNTGIEPLFPLWGIPTHELAHQMIAEHYKAVLTCVDSHQLSSEFAGRCYDEALLDQLPLSVDPCGENGEFHTFVYDAPYFSTAIPLTQGVVKRDGQFVFCDFIEDRVTLPETLGI